MSVRALIVDDEPLAREGIRLRLARLADVEIVGECVNGRQAVEAIRRETPDLAFLDVQMPGFGGFEVLNQVGPEAVSAVIFVTAYDRYALQAFEVHALDYLLKPIDDDRFRAAVERARRRLGEARVQESARQLRSLLADLEPAAAASPEWARRFVVRQRERLAVVPVEELDWVEAAGDYVYLHTRRERHLLRETMKNLEERLDPRSFQRIHRRAIIHLERLREVRTADNGDYGVLLADGTLLRLGRSYRKRFLEVLERRV